MLEQVDSQLDGKCTTHTYSAGYAERTTVQFNHFRDSQAQTGALVLRVCEPSA